MSAEDVARMFHSIARRYARSKRGIGDRALAARHMRATMQIAVAAGLTDRDVLPILARLR